MASMVTLKDACCAGDRGLLRPLLKQAWAGSCSESVFGSGVRLTPSPPEHCAGRGAARRCLGERMLTSPVGAACHRPSGQW